MPEIIYADVLIAYGFLIAVIRRNRKRNRVARDRLHDAIMEAEAKTRVALIRAKLTYTE